MKTPLLSERERQPFSLKKNTPQKRNWDNVNLHV